MAVTIYDTAAAIIVIAVVVRLIVKFIYKKKNSR